MMNMSNEMVGKKLNSSQDTCLNEGVMLQFIHFFPYLILSITPDRPDHLSLGQLSNRTTFAWYRFDLVYYYFDIACSSSVSHERLIVRPSLFSI